LGETGIAVRKVLLQPSHYLKIDASRKWLPAPEEGQNGFHLRILSRPKRAWINQLQELWGAAADSFRRLNGRHTPLPELRTKALSLGKPYLQLLRASIA